MNSVTRLKNFGGASGESIAPSEPKLKDAKRRRPCEIECRRTGTILPTAMGKTVERDRSGDLTFAMGVIGLAVTSHPLR